MPENRAHRAPFLAVALAFLAPALSAQGPGANPIAQAQQAMDSGQPLNAAAILEPLCQREPGNGAAWNQLGSARLVLNDNDGAVKAFERAVALLPGERTVEQNLAIALFSAQRHADAKKILERLVEKDAGNARAQLFLARIADGARDAAEAERRFRAALAAPGAAGAMPWFYGLFLVREQRLEDACVQFRRALELDPELKGAHLQLAICLRRMGQVEPAEEHMKRFRELDELTVGAQEKRMKLNSLMRDANRELEADRPDRAHYFATQALELGPQFPSVHALLARIYRAQGRDADASRADARARELDAGQPPR